MKDIPAGRSLVFERFAAPDGNCSVWPVCGTPRVQLPAFDQRLLTAPVQLFGDNVQAPYLLVSVLAPKMVARGDGVIINVASRAGTVGQPDTAAYGATKAALASLARSWAAEYGPAGIRVNAISPGPVYTNAADREVFDASAQTTLLGRAAEPQEIAYLIGFLASPHAAYITGTNIAIDGGRAAVRQHRRLDRAS